jgi:two-component system, NarL family, sensor histidine kinase UhpB
MSPTKTDKKTKILLVEDNPGDARLIQEMLKSDHTLFELDTVDRLSAAFNQLKSARYDIMLLDLGLPDSQGLETMERVRKLAADMPIIIMTGMADEMIGIQAVEQGAQDFLIKWEANEAILTRTINYAIERKRLEENLRDSEERYRNIVETAGEGIWMVDVDDKTIFVNQQMADMLGYKIEEMLGRPDHDFMDDEARQIAQSHFDRLRAGIKDRYDFCYRRKNGSEFWAIVSSTPLLDGDNGAYNGSLKMIADINDRKKNEIREKARFVLLNKLRSAKSIDECLQFGCKAFLDSNLFRRAAFTFFDGEGNLVNFGQAGLEKTEINAIKRTKAPDNEQMAKLTNPGYRISKSNFVPQGSLPETEQSFPNISSNIEEDGESSWKAGDILFTLIPQLNDEKNMGLVSVAVPYTPQRPPSPDQILHVEEIIDMIAIRVRELRHAEALSQERQALAEKNVALKEIMSVIEAEKMEIRQQIAGMIDQILKPAVGRLVRRDGMVNKTYYDLLKYNLEELSAATGAALHISSKLSPREMEISSMIKNGASSKDIAESLDIALVTVQKHREVIRKKLGLTNKNINLTTHLRSL